MHLLWNFYILDQEEHRSSGVQEFRRILKSELLSIPEYPEAPIPLSDGTACVYSVLKCAIAGAGGVSRAADIIEQAVSTGKPVLA